MAKRLGGTTGIIILTIVLSFGLMGCGSGGGGGDGGGEIAVESGVTKTVTLTGGDGNIYTVTADAAIADGISITTDIDISVDNSYSADQTPLIANFQRLNIPYTQQSTFIDIQVKYSASPDRMLVSDKNTGELRYQPFYNESDGSTLIRFNSIEDVSLLPVTEGAGKNLANAKAVKFVPFNDQKMFEILQNDGTTLKIKIDPALKADLCFIHDDINNRSLPCDVISNDITID